MHRSLWFSSLEHRVVLIGAATTGLSLAAALGIHGLLPPLQTILVVLLAAVATGAGLAVLLRPWMARLQQINIHIEAQRDDIPLAETPDAIGDLLRAIAAQRDHLAGAVEVKKAHRQQAELSDRYETEFLKSLSHELRTPLNAIVGFTQVLLEEIDGPLTESQREDLETVQSAGQHLTELVDDVLDLTAMQSARFQLERASMDARQIFQDVAKLLRGSKRAGDVEVLLHVPEQPLMIHADRKRLQQVAMNLASNALKFTEAGHVTLSARQEDQHVVLQVEDTGPGIRSEDLARIFEEFAQAGEPRRRGQGTGLGLAICQRLVDLHGGRISVESVVGAGSTFRVHLPMTGPAA